jgi:hypothetical protein
MASRWWRTRYCIQKALIAQMEYLYSKDEEEISLSNVEKIFEEFKRFVKTLIMKRM